MQIARRRRPQAAISLVAMIDVLMIMLVFFMVTSTYLDLDMVEIAGGSETTGPAQAPGQGDQSVERLLLRIAADGTVVLRGRPIEPDALSGAIAARLREAPALDVIVLPSGGATVQALARVMDAAVAGGAERLRIVRLEGQP